MIVIVMDKVVKALPENLEKEIEGPSKIVDLTESPREEVVDDLPMSLTEI